MDKEHFHSPYFLGQAVQRQGLSQDGALAVVKGLVHGGWWSMVGSRVETGGFGGFSSSCSESCTLDGKGLQRGLGERG